MKSSSNNFVCTECGNISSKWIGKCVSCGGWNTYMENEEERMINKPVKNNVKGSPKKIFQIEDLITINNESKDDLRFITGIDELDRVFGGGIYKGSISLLSGEPGIGKSTLTLNICESISKLNQKVVYVSGEESVSQIANRAHRLGIKNENIFILNECSAENILATCFKEEPNFLVLDSIQVMYAESTSGNAGSINQIRFVTEIIMEYAKRNNITVLLIGHVTKDGTLAGPRVLEHLVDTVLFLEGERTNQLRILKSEKNRFGPTDEVGVFQMSEKGLIEVKNPSEIFLEGRMKGASGSVITASIEGTRSFLIEIQSLVTYTKFGFPKRTSVGFDNNRLQMLLAVLSRYTKVNLDSYDVYLNIVGGLRLKETGLDVPILLSLISSKLQKSLPENTVSFGEVGLTGEIRNISFLEKRIKESHKLGMDNFIIPFNSKVPELKGVKYLKVKHVGELMKLFE